MSDSVVGPGINHSLAASQAEIFLRGDKVRLRKPEQPIAVVNRASSEWLLMIGLCVGIALVFMSTRFRQYRERAAARVKLRGLTEQYKTALAGLGPESDGTPVSRLKAHGRLYNDVVDTIDAFLGSSEQIKKRQDNLIDTVGEKLWRVRSQQYDVHVRLTALGLVIQSLNDSNWKAPNSRLLELERDLRRISSIDRSPKHPPSAELMDTAGSTARNVEAKRHPPSAELMNNVRSMADNVEVLTAPERVLDVTPGRLMILTASVVLSVCVGLCVSPTTALFVSAFVPFVFMAVFELAKCFAAKGG